MPDAAYGHGIVNPYLALTAIRDNAACPVRMAQPKPIAAVPPRPPVSRHLQHLAPGVGAVTLIQTARMT